jgi:PGF-CTERM protein
VVTNDRTKAAISVDARYFPAVRDTPVVRFERLLAGVAVAVVLLTAAGIAIVPGALADHDEPVRPGRIDVTEVTVERGPVAGSTATLHVTAALRHRGGRSRNVSAVVRAVDDETGFVVATTRRNLSTVAGDRERRVNQSVTVEREGGYRIETLVYADGERVDTYRQTVRGVGTLQPAYARSTVDFHRFDGGESALPSVQYTVAETDDDRVTLNVSAYLTNRGDAASAPIRLVLIARQADSNIVADRATLRVDGIRPGRTATPAATLTVPDGYNYYLDAILRRDGVIVGSARSAANLDPTETIDVDTTRREVGLEVSDFADEEGEPAGKRDRPPEARPTETEAGGPGLGVGAAVAGLLGAALLLRRRSS